VSALSYVVAVVNCRTYADLEECLASIEFQSAQPLAVLVVDVEPIERERARLAQRFRRTIWIECPNRGYAAGANRALEWTQQRAAAAEYALILNPDVRLEPDFAERILEHMKADRAVVLASGKLVRPEGLLDSTGIELPRHRRPRDRGSEEPDRGQYDRTEYVFGVSGAALMLRVAAVPDLTLAGELFDEDFFLYHEDTDLAWRAQRLGWKALYVPSARAVHTRRWRRDQRFEVPAALRRHSFKNHYLQLVKNEELRDGLINLPVTIAWELTRLCFVIARDRELLPAYGQALRLLPRAYAKRRELRERLRQRAQPPGPA
jgi:GT2 family glycosyltransferase